MKTLITCQSRVLATVLLLLAGQALLAQKNVEPVANDAVLGIALPPGSKMDKRGLSRSIAEMVVNPPLKQQGMEVDRISVYSLPPSGYSYDSLCNSMKAEGWQLSRQSDKDFTLATRGSDQVMVYFKSLKKQADLYVATCKAGTPVQPSTPMGQVGSQNTAGQPVSPVPQAQPQGAPVNDPDALAWINKTWIKNSSVSPEYGNAVATGMAGYVKSQLQFRPDGTYEFYSKVFGYSMQELILIREKGSFTINGNQLTLIPVSNILETWSKKDKNDKFGTLLSTQKLELERTTYIFQHHYFSGIQEWNLLLQVNPPTRRDGPYGQNPAFENTYFYRPAGPTSALIDLPN